MRRARALWVVVGLLCGLTSVAAQTGGITVRVEGAEGPLPGATVTISHPTGYVKETAQRTDDSGTVTFPVLRATGSTGVGYTVAAIFPGFATQRVVEVKVRIGQTTQVPIRLSQEIVERVEVTARAEIVNLEQTESSTKFSDEFIRDLPVPGRFYQNVLTLAPGVQDSDGDGNPNVHGSRDRDFKAIVSGVSNVDPLTGQQMSQVNPNSIEEMEVITAGAGVEFSRAQGGFARILQKQGSNDFEGVFELYYRSDLLDGDGGGDFSNERVPGFDWFQPAVQVSGPIVKDKLWYRLSHEIIDREIPTNVTTGIAVVQDEWGIHSDQLTWQASPRNKLAFQFQADPRKINNFGVSSTTPEEAAVLIDRESETMGLTWTAPLSPKILIESQVAWQDLNSGVFPSTRDVRNNCVQGPDFVELAQCFNVETGAFSGSYPFEIDDHRQRLTVRGDATVYAGKFWGMTHQFKVGMIIENERYFREQVQHPSVNFFLFQPSQDAVDDGPAPPFAVVEGEFAAPEQTQVRATGVTWGIYAEDQVKPLPNLTITLGVRVDREEIDSGGNGTLFPETELQRFVELLQSGVTPQQATQRAFTAYESQRDFYRQLAQTLDLPFNTVFAMTTPTAQQSEFWAQKRRADSIALRNTNLSPFLAVAWDPWRNGKTKIAATARRYYDKAFLNVPLIELNAPTAFLALDTFFGPGGWIVTGLRNGISPTVNVYSVERELATPYQDELTLSFEREVFAETSIKLTYIDRRYREQFQDVDLNHVAGDFGICRLATVADPRPIRPILPDDPGYDPALAPGDGVIDDCAGAFDVVPVSQQLGTFGLERPDGLADLYVQNPGWGNVLQVGNLNRIDYEAYVLELVRRQYRGWELQGSYTWSEARGDGEDFQQALGNDRTLIEDERGFQSYDQRHVVKVSATSVTPWGVRLGGALTWQSGLPYSILERRLSFDAVPPVLGNLGAGNAARTRTRYLGGARNSERNVSYWNLDLKLAREIRLKGGLNLQVSAEVFNVLNDNTYMVYSPLTESGQQINGSNEAIRRFGRQWQVGAKLAF